MADFPTPRSLSQISGEMLETFLSRFGARGIKPGSPILGFIEAAAQSDAKNAQDIFNLLVASNIDLAKGVALDKHGADEGLTRFGATYGSGKGTVGDNRYTKMVAKVWQGSSAPIAGSTIIFVSEASTFPAGGSIYLGRGTANYEGPIAFTKTLEVPGVWRLTLNTPTQRYHPVGDTVILAQGGNRIVPVGTAISTPQGNLANQVSFRTTSEAVLPDGEISLSDVPFTCEQSGPVGNVPAGSITSVTSPAFTGMTFTNPNPVSNARDIESDDAFRSRIKAFRRAKALGSDTAILLASFGVVADDESATVSGASIVRSRLGPTTLYVDDGTGYEEKAVGIPFEVVLDEAQGGEQKFQLANGRPVAKAFIKTIGTAPYTLSNAGELSVLVGGVLSTHVFASTDFDDITAASAYEVVASINANAALSFLARTSDNGTRVIISAKTETNEDIEVVVPDGIDANVGLNFPVGAVETVRLYKNDAPLYKDGLEARLYTNPQSDWSGFANGDTLIINVDGTGYKTYTFSSDDFNQFGLTTISENHDLDKWVTVFNSKVVGVTARNVGNKLSFTSNLGRSDRASLVISSDSTLIQKKMFSSGSLSATGKNSDYVLDRNRGEIELTTPLVAGDRLTAGSPYTRGYIESAPFTSITLANAFWWFAVDGNTSLTPVNLSTSYFVNIDEVSGNTVKRLSVLDNAVAAPLLSLLEVGDWVIIWDTDADANYQSTLRVTNVDPNGTWVDVESSYIPGITGTTQWQIGNISAYAFAKSSAPVQMVTANGTYTTQGLASSIESQLFGADVVVYQNDFIRILTSSYETGDIALITQNNEAAAVGFPISTSKNTVSHIAAIESGNVESGIPAFKWIKVDSVSGADVTAITAFGLDVNEWAGMWMRPLPTASMEYRFGWAGNSTAIGKGAADFSIRNLYANLATFNGSRLAVGHTFLMSPYDDLSVTIDKDQINKTGNVNMYREVTPEIGSAYNGSAIRLTDVVSGKTLVELFGDSFDFKDFILYMNPRVIPHRTDSKAIMWRLNQFGPEYGSMLSYKVPLDSDQPASVIVNFDMEMLVDVVLPSGPEKTGYFVGGVNAFAMYQGSAIPTATDYVIALGYEIASITRDGGGTVTVTLQQPPVISDPHLENLSQVVLDSADGDYPSGVKDITKTGTWTFTYVEAGPTPALKTNPTNIFVLPGNTDQQLMPHFDQYLAAGDMFRFTPPDGAGWPIGFSQSTNPVYKLDAVGAGYLRFKTDVAASGTASYVSTNASQFKFWSVSVTTTDLVAAINDPNVPVVVNDPLTTGSVGVSPLFGTAIGNGTLVKSSVMEYFDGEEDNPSGYLFFEDGVNYIDSQSIVTSNYQFVLKNDISTNLSAPNNYEDEVFRLVPTTAKNISDYLAMDSVSGINSLGAGLSVSSKAGKVQIFSDTLGTSGAVGVNGGKANSLQVNTYRTPILGNTGSILETDAEPAKSLIGSNYIAIQNSIPDPKFIDFNAKTMTLTAASKSIASNAWGNRQTLRGRSWYVEKNGNFACYALAEEGIAPSFNFSGYVGDWVYINQAYGGWNLVSTSSTYAATVTKLKNGKILFVGGESGGVAVDTCFIYDPASGSLTAAANLPAKRKQHAAVLLGSGKVLVTGGKNDVGAVQATGYLYDPDLDSWTTTVTNLNEARFNHAMALMADGNVVVLGGNGGGFATKDTWEVYDPLNNVTSFTLKPTTMNSPREGVMAIRYATDRLFVAGGQNGATTYLSTTEYLDYGASQWNSGPSMATAKAYYGATTLDDGRILIADGTQADGPVASTSVYAFNPVTVTVEVLADCPVAQMQAAAVKLNDGKVLVTGDDPSGSGAANLNASIYDPVTDTWVSGANASVFHGFGSLVVLDNGRVIGSGTDTELFDPEIRIASENVGLFQIVGVIWSAFDGFYGFWVENPNAVEQYIGLSTAYFMRYDDPVPGDKINIPAPGVAGNSGVYTVSGFGSAANAVTVNETVLDSGGAVSALVGTTVMPPKPARFIKTVDYIHPKTSDTWLVALTDQKFAGATSTHISSNFGSAIEALGKLSFPTNTIVGKDGYSHSTGLIAAVNRVLEGDESNRDAYPGVLASGSVCNISGPIVKRIRMTFDVRINTNVSIKTIIQSAVTSYINSQPVGTDIAISEVIKVIQEIDGVVAVAVVYPTYGQGHDKIPLQPYEKAMVLNAASDIGVNIIGE